MATLDASVVNIALPTLQRRSGVPLTTIEWVVLAYIAHHHRPAAQRSAGSPTCAAGARVYGAGLLLFTIASRCAAWRRASSVLIAARVLQGLGAALVSANGSALLVSAFPLEERGRALGAFGAMVGIGLAIGSPLGRRIVAHASWRWLFLINVPLGLLTFCAAAHARARRPRRRAGRRRARPRRGRCCGAARSPALMLALSRGPDRRLGAARGAAALFGGAVALLAAFAAAERRAAAAAAAAADLFGPLGARGVADA